MFQGREGYLARATAALTSGGVAIIGPAGVGKTSLARTVTSQLDTRQTCVVWVAATQASRQVPFGALAGLMSASSSADATVVFPCLRETLAERAAGRRVVLVVDDAHLLDGPSSAVLLGLSAQARILATVRSGHSRPDAVTALWKDGRLHRLDLAPFDRDQTSALISALVGGEVARPTIDMLFQWTSGNALFLTELVRAGVDGGAFSRESGLWWWRAPLLVPPALADLFDQRVDGVEGAARDALAAVALSEPLALGVLERVVPSDVVVGLEDRGLLRTEENFGEAEGDVCVWFGHPMLGAAVRRRLSPARRRRSAAQLLDAQSVPPQRPLDVVRTALWQVSARRAINVDLVLEAVDLVLHSDPSLASKLANEAVRQRPSAKSSVSLASALVEEGRPDDARAVLKDAATTTTNATEEIVIAVALAGHRAWAERDPAGGHAELEALVARVPEGSASAEIRAVDALVQLFGGHAPQALEAAEAVLADPCAERPAILRARLAQATALTLVGRTCEALAAGERAAAEATQDPAGLPYATGLALAAVALAQLWRAPINDLPTSHPATGRWPVPPDRVVAGLEPTAWPLFDGYVRRVAGDLPGAIERLRAALVQQSGGEGLFRSEAAAWLALCLAEQERTDEAAAVLRSTPPDALALVPGLIPWVRAAIYAARGDLDEAIRQMNAAVAAARTAGCWLVELGYLMYEAEIRGPEGPGMVAARIREVLPHVDAPRLVVSAEATLTVVDADADDVGSLLDHVAALERMGLLRPALGLAEVAASLDGTERVARETGDRLRAALGLATDISPVELTPREAEVAGLAAEGMTDREIAEHLVLSVRTVESHLSRVYRKLDVISRRQLAAALRCHF